MLADIQLWKNINVHTKSRHMCNFRRRGSTTKIMNSCYKSYFSCQLANTDMHGHNLIND